MKITTFSALEIGRSYRAVLDEDGSPVLELVITRGRPRSLKDTEIIAARAMREIGFTISDIADVINTKRGAMFAVSASAIRTALVGR